MRPLPEYASSFALIFPDPCLIWDFNTKLEKQKS